MKIINHILFSIILVGLTPNPVSAKLKNAKGGDVQETIEQLFPELKPVRVHPSMQKSKIWTAWMHNGYSLISLSNKNSQITVSWVPKKRTKESEAETLAQIEEIIKELRSNFKNIPKEFNLRHTEMKLQNKPSQTSLTTPAAPRSTS